MSFQTILNRLAPPDYALLPSHSSPAKHDNSSLCWSRLALSIPRRYARIFSAGLAALFVYFFLFSDRFWTPHDDAAFPAEAWPGPMGKPPLYNQYREYERHLPAHNPDLPYPDGKYAKFIYFGNFQKGVGWGNVLQEMMYNAYFAHHVKRSFVFYNYTWDLEGPDYSTYNGHLIPARIPISAIISGPMVGGEMGPDDTDVPRAVSLDYFNEVCPKEERYILNGNDVKRGLPWDPPARVIFNALLEKVYATDARCIEIPRGTEQIFDYILFGSDHALDLWPELRQSPIFTKFQWSPIIHAAYNNNRQFFELEPTSFLAALYAPISKQFAKISKTTDSLSPMQEEILDGLLVLHIRRGDFDVHCWNFIEHSSGYNGYNSFEELPDHFTIPSGESKEERAERYMVHCFPNVTQIVDRVKGVSKKVDGLRKVYIMTNGKGDWLAELRAALLKAGEWEVSTSRDLFLSWEQKPISQALDMYVAQRAQAFIGNGFSSLTSNVVMFRMGNPSLSPNQSFFW